MSRSFRAIRQLERFVFRGVPEQPEPTWERNTMANVEERYTGKSQCLEEQDCCDTEEGELIATIIHHPAQGTTEVIREDSKS